MQRRVLQLLQLVSSVEHLGQAVPLAWHESCQAHRSEAFSFGVNLLSATVLCAFTSLVTVEGLTSILLAIARAESLSRTPDSITSLFSLIRCFPFPLAISHLLSRPRGKRLA